MGAVLARAAEGSVLVALGSVFVSQLAVLHRYQSAADRRRGLNPFHCAA